MPPRCHLAFDDGESHTASGSIIQCLPVTPAPIVRVLRTLDTFNFAQLTPILTLAGETGVYAEPSSPQSWSLQNFSISESRSFLNMRFSLAIAIALLLSSYVAGVPVYPNSSPEEGEISDNGSPDQQGHTPQSRTSGQSGGSSSNPSIGLGLNPQHRGEIGSAELGHYATPDRFDRNPSSGHWGISHPVVVHGQSGDNLAVTPMSSTRTTNYPAGDYGFTGQRATSHLEVAGGPRYIPEHAFQQGSGGMQQTPQGYRALVRANRDEVQNRQDPPPAPHNPGYSPQVLQPMHWGQGPSTSGPPPQPFSGPAGMPPSHLPQRPPPLRQSTMPAYGSQQHQYAPVRQSTLPPPPPGLPANPLHAQQGFPPPPQMMHQYPQGSLPPPPPHLPPPPHMYNQGSLPPPPSHLPLPPHMQGTLPPPPSHLPLPPHMQGTLPPPSAGLPPRPPSRGGSGRGRGANRFQPYGRGPGGSGTGV
ncbi:hypothetical protein F5887DRAFT_957509 [Amanita rubescens]|nr:hypothetical protein F5887DRAFT_957509 [Amanita rubescens]